MPLKPFVAILAASQRGLFRFPAPALQPAFLEAPQLTPAGPLDANAGSGAIWIERRYPPAGLKQNPPHRPDVAAWGLSGSAWLTGGFLIAAGAVTATRQARARRQTSAPQRAARAPQRSPAPRLQAFKTPKSTDDAMVDQISRLESSGMSPAEYEQATRSAAKEYLMTKGPHAEAEARSGEPQRASFLKQLWDVDEVDPLPAGAAADSSRVRATIYEIGGPLTNVLSTSVAKKLPLIPHVGIRVHGVEYFYSDHIEFRTVPVMEEMLGDRPQVSLDLGPSRLSAEDVQAEIAALEADWTADDYHVFDKNCVHFGVELARRICADTEAGGAPQPLMQGVIDVSERMLDSLPEWRRALGRRVMNEVTRLVVVSWGKASKNKKEAIADNLGLERGA
jgi:hypothetical protein